MAIRNIRSMDEEIFRKRCKEVTVFDDKLINFVQDLIDTMHEMDAIGLAATHVGVLKRVVVADIGEGSIEIINPKIISQSGEEIELEGSVSLPGIRGEVKRPTNIVIEGKSSRGENVEITAKGLLARVLCHEIDQLDGIKFTDRVIRYENN